MHTKLGQRHEAPAALVRLPILRRVRGGSVSEMPVDDPRTRTVLSLRALATTKTELKLMAAAAMIGPRRIPNTGLSTPRRHRHTEAVVDSHGQVLADLPDDP